MVLFAIISAAPCFAHHMAVVVSKQNSVSALSSAQLRKIFLVETKKWPDGENIQLVCIAHPMVKPSPFNA